MQSFKAASELEPPRYRTPPRSATPTFCSRRDPRTARKTFFRSCPKRSHRTFPARVYLMRIACSAKTGRRVRQPRPERSVAGSDQFRRAAYQRKPQSRQARCDCGRALVRTGPQIERAKPSTLVQPVSCILDDRANGRTAVNGRKYIDSAEGFLTTAVQLSPNYDQAVLLLAELKIRKGSGASAVELLTRIVETTPANRRSP